MTLTPLAEWETFSEIIGSAAAALTGLQFVVIVLVAQAGAARSMLEIRAFGTPTVVHFCAALVIAGITAAPWHTLHGAAYSLAACGAAGVLYAIRVIVHARRQTGYQPDAGDWWWFAVFPLLAYASLVTAAITLFWNPTPALFAIAAVALSLLFIGIHNSWDTVTFVAVQRFAPAPNSQAAAAESTPASAEPE